MSPQSICDKLVIDSWLQDTSGIVDMKKASFQKGTQVSYWAVEMPEFPWSCTFHVAKGAYQFAEGLLRKTPEFPLYKIVVQVQRSTAQVNCVDLIEEHWLQKTMAQDLAWLESNSTLLLPFTTKLKLVTFVTLAQVGCATLEGSAVGLLASTLVSGLTIHILKIHKLRGQKAEDELRYVVHIITTHWEKAARADDKQRIAKEKHMLTVVKAMLKAILVSWKDAVKFLKKTEEAKADSDMKKAKVHKAFHLERLVTFISFNLEVAEMDTSSVFEAGLSPWIHQEDALCIEQVRGHECPPMTNGAESPQKLTLGLQLLPPSMPPPLVLSQLVESSPYLLKRNTHLEAFSVYWDNGPGQQPMLLSWNNILLHKTQDVYDMYVCEFATQAQYMWPG
ncbi:hypothetical protein BS47DRAFT_1366229 [Hydnum rufescens UP504]|uniref:Uncharacterized protein n=1 Tax=Hydnum rufescens UP504 TaxID=1448309 RepID=A0A9P6DML3_9AGAM|nr:hypothetical protein BS47DRAFT_1366229 [Hydnum rufescens UP504]